MEPHTDLDQYYKEKVDELLAKERRQTGWLALKCVIVLSVLLALVLLATGGCETLRHPTQSEFDAARDVLNEWENPDIAPDKPIERQRTLWWLDTALEYVIGGDDDE